LADNVRDSVRKGDAVLVHGRLRTDVWEREDGHTSVTHVVEATVIGHDMNRGTSTFTKSLRSDRADSEDETASVHRELLHQSVPLGALDSFGEPRATPGQSSAA
jgi:single-strand DNA-binding protein